MIYQPFGMEMRQTQLKNGLTITYFPKIGFSKTFAMIAVRYGAIDTIFTHNGVQYHTPAGVAHFLEHKMFEDIDGNALQKFGQTGASPNAFTSYAMTAYHFSCTEQFYQNLELLLHLVFTPYFTPENVKKEKGIIAQEIGMMEDTPEWVTYVNVLTGMYHEHPLRVSIAGSVDSIEQITPDILNQCYQAFYCPANMNLIVCGTADFDQVVEMAERLSPSQVISLAISDYGMRQDTVASSEMLSYRSVSQPVFLLGLKDVPLGQGENRLSREMIGELAARLLCGKNSPLFSKLYREGWINRRFDTSYSIFPQAAFALCGGESRDPFVVRERLLQQVHHYAVNGVDPALFARMKKACYGMMVRTLDQPEELCRAQAETGFSGIDYLNFAQLWKDITIQDVQQRLIEWDRANVVTLSAVLPTDWQSGER